MRSGTFGLVWFGGSAFLGGSSSSSDLDFEVSVDDESMFSLAASDFILSHIIQFICILESQVVECSMGSFYTQDSRS